MAYATIPKDKLKITEQIAQGGFGTVYKAIRYTGLLWNKKKQIVAVKRVTKKEGEHELKFLSKLDHPNIVKLLGVADNDVNGVDIILEFCDGGSLRDYLDEHRGQCLGQRFYDWIKQAGRPIAYLKKIGVVHKDIKSPNYLITNGYILKLCDFGLAKKMDTTMTSATERASYPWMAPELLKDSTLSPTYDIFAYGVVIWELWTTDPPFEGCESVNVIYRICHKNERPPIPATCPKQIADLMKRCWETDWKKRPNMEQALSLLESAEKFHQMQKTFATGRWELQKEFGFQDGAGMLRIARDIAVYPNGDIAIPDSEDARVCVYSNETIYKFSLDLKQRKHRRMRTFPANVTVNADGIIYVTCNCYVLMYTAQGDYEGRWAAMSHKNKPSDTEYIRLRGLTIDNNGQVLVGQVLRPMYISKHRQGGSHIASIKVNISPYHLAATSHDTIVIGEASWGHTVQIVDSTGDVLHTLNDNKQVSLWRPWGVCCHNDIIFVCNTVSYEISCFSVSAEYIGSIPIKYVPWGVTIAKDTGKLLVKCSDRVLIYRNKQLPL